MTATTVPPARRHLERPLTSRRMLRAMLALAVAIVVAIVLVTLRGAYQSVEELSDKIIGHTTQRTDAELEGFFKPVEQLLWAAEGWGRAGHFDIEAPQRMNEIFQPVVKATPVSSLMVGRSDGAEYMLLEKESGWQNRITPPNPTGVSRAIMWDKNGKVLHDAPEKVNYDPRRRPWFKGAIKSKRSEIHFTKPYTFFTTKDPGITASVRFRPSGAKLDHVIAFDVKLMDVSRFTTSLIISDRAQLVVLTDDRKVIGLPTGFRGTKAIKASVLKTPEELGLDATVDQLVALGGGLKTAAPSRFASGGEPWWGGIQSFQLASGNNLWILVAVPEVDLTGGATSQRNIVLAILFVLLLGIVLTMFLVDKALKKDVQAAVHRERTLGQYTLEEKLGAGGMGEVYRASHAMLRRPTAVKLLNREKAKSEIALSRFEREVQITAELTHPNTIAVYDFGHTPEGEFYYAMEYIDGVTLHDLVHRGGPMSASRTIHVLRQVCGSLQEAHERGLIHRDIKPANIMLCERGGMCDVVKVLDFGLVKSDEPVDSVKLTRANALTGTPLYLPPEAATDPASVDARSDVYALGAVAYFMLTGRPLFRGRSIVEIVTQHMTAVPTPPSEVEPSVPADLERVILSCLEKSPDQRPGSARALSERLSRCAAAEEWTQDLAKAWWDEHRGEVMLRVTGDTNPQTKTMTVAINPSVADAGRDLKSKTG